MRKKVPYMMVKAVNVIIDWRSVRTPLHWFQRTQRNYLYYITVCSSDSRKYSIVYAKSKSVGKTNALVSKYTEKLCVVHRLFGNSSQGRFCHAVNVMIGWLLKRKLLVSRDTKKPTVWQVDDCRELSYQTLQSELLSERCT